MRSLNSQAFENVLEKSKERCLYTNLTNIIKRYDSAEFSIEQCKKRINVTIAKEVFCTCGPSKRVDRKSPPPPPRIIWIFVNVFHMDEADPFATQVSFNSMDILSFCSDEIPHNQMLENFIPV